MEKVLLWGGFNLFILVMIAIDLGVFNKSAHKITVKEALTWSVIWIALAMLFCGGLYYWQGHEIALQFLSGYLIEKSLSVDNIFVFLLLFSYFKVKSEHQHIVLEWGIIGALLMRGALILLGTALIQRFEWVMYIFGAFLVYTGIKMGVQGEDEEVDPTSNPVFKLARRMFPVTDGYRDRKFFVMEKGKRFATPLFLVLLVVETTDLVFALDSIPAIFAVSRDAFIVYSSNVFAVMGLRSLYFALAGIMDTFHYLKIGLAVILTFVGAKMIVEEWLHIETWMTLTTIGVVLLLSVLASLVWPKKESDAPVQH